MDFFKNLMTPKTGFFAVFIVVFINLIIIDSFLIRGGPTRTIEKITEVSSSETKSTPKPIDENSCPVSCTSQIKEATSSIKLANSPVPQPQTTTTSTSQDTYISLGSGSNATDDWSDLPNAQEYIDSTKYYGIKTVTFEASVKIPTGNQTAYVRLFNSTDKHPVWFSDISLEGGTPKFLISKPIELNSGNKLYQVQMKTSLKYTSIVDKAWVHIVFF